MVGVFIKTGSPQASSNPPVSDRIGKARAEATAKRLAASKPAPASNSVEVSSPTGGEKTQEQLWDEVKNNPKMQAIVRNVKGDPNAVPPPPREESKTDLFPGFQGFTRDLQNTFAGALTRGGSDYVSSFLSGKPVEQETFERGNALARTGAAGQIAETVGKVAPYFALPQAWFAGPVRAAATSTIATGVDESAESLIEKGTLPSLKQLSMQMGTSALLGVAGYYVGKFIQGSGGATPTIAEDTAKELKAIQGKENTFTSVITGSRAIVNNVHLGKLVDNIEARILRNRDMRNVYKSRLGGKYARKAIGLLRELQRSGTNASFGYVSEMAAKIRDSVRNSDYEIIAQPRDEEMVNMIYKELDSYLENLPNTKGMEVFNRPAHGGKAGIDEAVSNYKSLKEMHRLVEKNSIVQGVMKRAADQIRLGVPYDRALQAEFQRLMRPNKKGKLDPILKEFDAAELDAFQKMGEGGELTYYLNVLDHSFGHGVIGHFHRTYALITRKYAKAGAEAEARETARMVNPNIPPMPSITPPAVGGQIGAGVGAAMTEPQVDQMGNPTGQ